LFIKAKVSDIPIHKMQVMPFRNTDAITFLRLYFIKEILEKANLALREFSRIILFK